MRKAFFVYEGYITMRSILTILFFLFIYGCGNAYQNNPAKVKPGAQVLIEKHLQELEGKRVGLVMNPTARINNEHVLDTLLSLGVNITALFAPEHGFRGSFSAGELIENGVDQQTGLPVFSLYGTNKKPTSDMLGQVDMLLFDMQDVGARFYTYNTTMKYVIEAASEQGKEVWILDRPNPAGGNYVAGWVLEEEFESMVGAYPIPVAHGLTLGELALMAKGEGWFDTKADPLVKVIPMEGWERTMKWTDTGLPWIPPSPNLPTFNHAYVYLGSCFIEGTSLSEGRGTSDPFLTLGAPTFAPDLLMLEKLALKYAVQIDTISFTPISIPGKASSPKYQDEKLKGISITPLDQFSEPVEFGVELTHALMDMTSDSEYKSFIQLLSGMKDFPSASLSWGKNFDEYLIMRDRYLLYK